MILVYGQVDDPSIACLLQALQATGAAFVFLDNATLDQASLVITVGPPGVSGELVVGGKALSLQHIRAVYAHPAPPPVLDGADAANVHAHNLHSQLMDWLDIAPARVVSRPAAMQASGSKPLQAQRMGEAGFLVPATLVSSDPDAVRGFLNQHGRVVYTSISTADACVTELDDAGLSRMHRLSQLPTQFQALVPGTDICVHVVGEQVFAAEASGDAHRNADARRHGSALEWVVTTLPSAVASQCVAMSRTMGLPLAGIDLRLRPDGTYVCCDVDPMPAYSAFEAQSGLPLAAALAELLHMA
jgi:hypothetical protein